jgi:hypothetical protein
LTGYFLRKFEKAANFAASLLKSERKYHTLILLGDDGKIRHIRILKGIIAALLLLQVIILSSGAYFFFSGMSFIKDKREMENALMVSQKNYLTIRDEKDMLMARLVLAESLTGKEAGVAVDSKPSETSANTSVIQAPRTHVSNGRILVDKINVSHETAGNRLKIEFDIKNTRKSRLITGYSFVVLKGNEFDETGWLPVPSVPLASKRPAAVEKGWYFSTSKVTTVKLTTNIKSLMTPFKLATLFVYSASGELLLEKDFPVLLRSAKEL